MVSSSENSVEQKNIQSLVDQLAYLVDELAAQRVVLKHVSGAITKACPPGNTPW